MPLRELELPRETEPELRDADELRAPELPRDTEDVLLRDAEPEYDEPDERDGPEDEREEADELDELEELDEPPPPRRDCADESNGQAVIAMATKAAVRV